MSPMGSPASLAKVVSNKSVVRPYAVINLFVV